MTRGFKSADQTVVLAAPDLQEEDRRQDLHGGDWDYSTRAECSAAIKPPSPAACRIFTRMVNQRSVHSTHAGVQRPCARQSGMMARVQREPEFNGADGIDGVWSAYR
jgi:hypothetical protein